MAYLQDKNNYVEMPKTENIAGPLWIKTIARDLTPPPVFDECNRLTPWGREEIKELFRNGADEIEKRGHIQRSLMGANGEVCMLNSLHVACCGIPLPDNRSLNYSSYAVSEIVYHAAVLFADRFGRTICDFNNSHSKEQCIAAMRGMADVL